MDDQMCFECLQRRIHADFSDKLIFSHAISDSPIPFASTAVVQMPKSSGEASPQFTLVYIPTRERDCLRNYIEECCPKSLESKHHVESNGKTLSVVADRFGCNSSTCNFSGRFSCSRTITSLAPIALVGTSSYPILEELASNYFSGSVEDELMRSISLLIEGKATGRDSINFLSMIGIPSFDENGFPGCLRHPNIAPILGLLKTSGYINLVLPKTPYTLENIFHYSPKALKSEWQIKFLIYQLLSAVAHMHGLGIAHGNICPSNVMLTDSFWSLLRIIDKPQSSSNLSKRSQECSLNSTLRGCCVEGCLYEGLYADLKLSRYIDWQSAFNCWWKGELSNFEYLLVLNRLAGRRWGDRTFHTVMPWVIDFSVKPEETSDAGWRDLSKSKWRLAKGDEQLDFTYSTSEIPHHVSDECLSELAVCSYKARRLPLSVLRMAVRSVYEPNEYPSSMLRLYQWTPDECIPEFYYDPQIFYSVHSGMTDLAVPSWVDTPEEFTKLHRDALESNKVSCQIHLWIDITFGCKMSGEAAVAAKNVMLPASEPTMPKSVGRRQLFTQPHPPRQVASRTPRNTTTESTLHQFVVNQVEGEKSLLFETANLQKLEEAATFCEHAWYLSPLYCCHVENSMEDDSSTEESLSECAEKKTSALPDYTKIIGLRSSISLDYILEKIEADDDTSVGYQELLLWSQRSSHSRICSETIAEDIFSIGCILAELHLRRPLFDPTSLAMYFVSGLLPSKMKELPPHTEVLVESCLCKDWRRRSSAKCLLESPYFPTTVRSSYLFLAPLQLLAKDGLRLRYAANFAKQGVFKAMGPFAAEMCASYCLPLVLAPLSDIEAEWAYILLKEFLKCLKPKAVKTLILPAIQKILQASGYLHLKVLLLQESFVREIWNRVGKQAYLETIHPLVIINLYIAPHKSSAAAASVLLIGSSEELGVPATVHQTILPLIQCFGKGIRSDGIDVLVRIGGLSGENFVVRHILPLLTNVVRSCIDASSTTKPEPMQSWSCLALVDCLMSLDGLLAVLPTDVVIKQLMEDGSFLHVMVLMQTTLDISVLQVAATSLVAICERVGPDLTASHILPKLKELFDELAFSQETRIASGFLERSLKVTKAKSDEDRIESRMDLVLLLYPPFASLLGIEKLRQCCATWLLLEQFLLRCHNWKWGCTGDSSRSGPDNITFRRSVFSKSSTSEYNPAKLLLNGVGWSIPQSQGSRSAKNLVPHKRANELDQNLAERRVPTSTCGKHEPWHWFPSPAVSWDGPEFLSRLGNLKDELPWKIRASVIHSIRAHHGTLRSLAVCQDECTVFTAGVGSGFKGTVQKWNLSRLDITSAYYGHEEVVNDISILPSYERVASCDGTVHVWNSQTGKLISIFAESSTNSAHASSSPLTSAPKINTDQPNMLNSNPPSSGILSPAFDGSLYTCMHHLEFNENLVVGTGNGSLRFIDLSRGQKLHLWRSEFGESSFSSLISSICTCGSDKMQAGGAAASPSWIAAGLSSGMCRLLDLRSGKVISTWRAHDAYVTKLAAPEEHLLVSSSLDRTLRVWDLRRNWPPQPIVFRGHADFVPNFSVWGQDVISISKNKIGLSSLSRSADEDGQHRITPQYLYLADRGMRNMSMLSSLVILPFSRLFLVGTEEDLTDEVSFDAPIAGCDLAFHVATPINFASEDPENDMIKPAIQGVANVLRSCAEAGMVKQVILTPSAAAVAINQLNGTGLLMDESHWTDVDFLTSARPPTWDDLTHQLAMIIRHNENLWRQEKKIGTSD